MKKEIWKLIPQLENYYASDLGKIKHNNRVLKQYLNKKPHSKRVVYKVRIGTKDYSVARLVASAFYGISNMTVNHIDNNPLNNRADNLEWLSLIDNIKKGYETGAYQSIMKPIKLTNKNTKEIRVFRSIGECERFMGIHYDYLSKKMKKGIFENDTYSWETLKGDYDGN